MTSDRAARLAETMAGEVITPGMDAYPIATRVWNARFASEPLMVARCAGADDIQAAVRFARNADLPITVHGNGHSYAGESAARGGLLIDLSTMLDVAVDADAARAEVEPGATWGMVDAATQLRGLAMPGGTVSMVGVGGVTLGGGEGWLGRLHGLTLDNLVGADVVTATGDIVAVSSDEHPDLFWAIRGGGGNFGIVSSFRFGLHPFGPTVVAGQVIHRADRAGAVLRGYRAALADAPDEVMAYAFFFRIPPIPAFPSDLHGTLVLSIVVAYLGPPEAGESALRTLRSLAPDPIADTVGPVPYTDLQQAFDAGVGPGNRWYSRGHYLDDLTDAAIDTLVAGLNPFPGELTLVYLGPGGGQIGRVAPDATAYPHRRAAFGLHVWPGWIDAAQDDAVMRWARDLHGAMAAHANGGVYVNLLAEDEADRVPAAYGSNWTRLRQVKAAWDPDNVFRANHNIPPAT